MKVICIDNKFGIGSRREVLTELIEGTVYTVKEETEECGYLGYHLVEVDSFLRKGYLQKRFIPVSEIDETEMIREIFFNYKVNDTVHIY